MSNRKGKKMDAAATRFYSIGTLGVKGMSYIACMSRYSCVSESNYLEVLNSALENKRTKDLFLQKERMLLGKQLLTTAKHILYLFTKTLTSAMCLCHHT